MNAYARTIVQIVSPRLAKPSSSVTKGCSPQAGNIARPIVIAPTNRPENRTLIATRNALMARKARTDFMGTGSMRAVSAVRNFRG